MGSLTVVLKKGRHGYGFAVTGSSPAIISRVQEDSAAEVAGLTKGDCIVKINGQNVSRSMADSVAKIIRQSEQQIVIDIQRPDPIGEIAPPRALPPIHEEDALTSTPYRDDHQILVHDLRPDPHASHMSPDACQSPERPMSISSSSPSQLSPVMTSSPASSNDDSFREDVVPSVDVSFQSLGTQEQERQNAIAKLSHLEAEFVETMHLGMERFSRPLRQYIISPSEYATLFQNVEKLVSFSECHIHRLKEKSLHYSDSDDCPESERYTEIVGAIFKPRADMMAEAYEEYCNGLKNSFRLLMELHEDEEFNQFIKNPPVQSGEPSISQFLQRPLQHIKDLVLTLQQIAVNTSPGHHDYEEIKAVIEILRNCCNRINESNTRRSRSNMSVVSATPSTRSRMSHRSKAPSRCQSRTSNHSDGNQSTASNQSMMSIASVDAEVMDIQGRLVFPEHLPAFQLATATRHMIYSGDLLLFDGLLWNRVFAVLMSDLFLMTRPDQDNYLSVMQEPIILHTIDHLVINGSKSNEFSVVMAPSQGEGALIFQAPTKALKATWTHVLQQRVCASKAQLIIDNNLDNIV